MKQIPTTNTTHGVCLVLANKLNDGQNETSKYWVLIGVSSSNPSPQGSGISVEGEAELGKSQRRWVTTKGHSLFWTPRDPCLYELRDCDGTGSSQPKPHAWKVPVDTTSHPNQETMCNRYLLGQGKSVSSDGKSLAVATTHQGRLHAQEQLASHHKTYRVIFISGKREFC